MTLTASRTRPSTTARRTGYVAAVLVNVAMLYAVNVWPGWEAVPFLTDDTPDVLGLVNLSILAGVIANVVYLARDPVWLKALGDLLTTSVGLAAAIQIWQVFPFVFDGSGFDWAVLVRWVLVVAIVGSVIGIVAAVVSFVRGVAAAQR